ncbi:hypothetical protein PACTADRAFT_77470 [Pachysolen tannophilus NRRL Y-2460]|uniref:Mitochondrial inner membrane i-AAA protease supercomplex subunit MGR3 n=1 Tax=Pachysolen tannophilus NRRL Y-2460 TaxID=669874 RepID=A0A1E4TQJ8_PACTA|nr:hypothetical protein PACTADRAFT_77470 [Pachysolen tannophilus NRRL Y-2460]
MLRIFAGSSIKKRLRLSVISKYYQQKPPRSWTKILLYTITGLTVSGYFAYEYLWPHHTFPSSVAKILRKGLWAESEKQNHDYGLALKYYKEALEECDKLLLDHYGDEYTGVQIKIGEMYERLHKLNEANQIYWQIATCYFDCLTNNEIPKSMRSHIIQKDLRIILKLAQLNGENPSFVKALLTSHLLLAQTEIRNKCLQGDTVDTHVIDSFDQTGESFGKQQNGLDKKILSSVNVADNNSIDVDSKNGEVVITVPVNSEIWEPFKDEFFNARDLLTSICIATGDLGIAINTKIKTTHWMLLAGCSPGDILISQCNLASLLYLEAEELEVKEVSLKKILKTITKEEFEKNLQDQRKLGLLNFEASSLSYEEYCQNIEKELQATTTSKEKCIELALQAYESVKTVSKKLTPQQHRENAEVGESIALSAYGLGVVHLHLSNYEKAEALLKESILRAKGSGYEELIENAERELAKLNEEKNSDKSIETKNQRDDSDDIELDIQVIKN